MFLVRPDAVEVQDTWHVDGMVATGSRDIVARAVLRAGALRLAARARRLRGRSAPLPRAHPGAADALAHRGDPLASARRGARSSCSGACSASACRSARASPRASARRRRCASPTRSPTSRAAETVLRAVARDLTAHARGGPPALAASTRSSCASRSRTSCATAARVVRDVMDGSGASVHYLDHELQRISRDVQMMSAHTVFDLDLVAEQCGRALLEADAPLFPTRLKERSPRAPPATGPARRGPPERQEALRADLRRSRSGRVAGHRDRHAGQLVDRLRERARLLRPHRARASCSTGAASARSRRSCASSGSSARATRAAASSSSRSTARRRAPSASARSRSQAIKAWSVATCYSPVERAVLAYTDCLVLEGGRVPDGVFDALHAELSDVEILEFTYITCTYDMHAIMSRALRLEYDDVDDPIRRCRRRRARRTT